MVKDNTPTAVTRELFQLTLAGGLAIVITAILFSTWLMPLQCAFWATSALAVWCYSLHLTKKRANLNRPDASSPPYPSLGWANRLSLLRAWLIALTSGFLWIDFQHLWLLWLPGIFYSVAAILDRIDGFVARRCKHTSLLGMELDTLFDALGLLIAPTLAVLMGKLHWSFLAVSLAFYSFSAGIWYRRKRNKPVYPLVPSQLRRAFAGIQMGFVAVVLLPLVPAIYTQWLGIAFMTPLLVGFLIDWLIVSGTLPAHLPSTQAVISRIHDTSQGVLLPLIRWVCALLIFYCIYPLLHGLHNTAILLTWCAFALLVGLAARTHALIALIALCLSSILVTPLWALCFTLCTWVLLLGPGQWNLWRGDDHWVNRQDGAE